MDEFVFVFYNYALLKILENIKDDLYDFIPSFSFVRNLGNKS